VTRTINHDTDPAAERSRGSRASRSKNWDKHVDHVEVLAHTTAFAALRAKILELAMLRPDDHVLDIGAGTGPLAFAAASRVQHVTALEVSAAMCRRLGTHRERMGISNVDTVLASATEMPLADDSIDVALSNYCFHNMSDAEKRHALEEIHRVLRPHGRLVISDMMFSLGVADPRDRAVLLLLAKRMLRKGLPGVARLAKNALRRLTGRWEHPASTDWWREALAAAGFVGVQLRALDHEGGIAVARKA
jgi:ubiquinone/menaquinone biosynthesis C-methylase UbiE